MGVSEFIVFHSSKESIKSSMEDAGWAKNFQFVADPERFIYRELGADFSGWRYLFRMRFSTLMVGLKGVPKLLRTKKWGMEAGVTQRPMDLLIDTSSGCIIDSYYSIDFNDQWSYEDVVKRVTLYQKAEGN